MPIHTGNDSKGPFVQWGNQKKYHYKANDKKSLSAAKSKAKKQMKAIYASGYKKDPFNLALETAYKELNLK